MQTVHVRVVDSETNKPTSVRIRFTDAAGHHYAPLGRYLNFPTTAGTFADGHLIIHQQTWFYVDGAFEIQLPPGAIMVEIAKGIERQRVLQQIQLVPGKLALRFVIDRALFPSRLGWFAGDVRAHTLTPHGALLEGAAEGLAIVHLLAREVEGSCPNLLAFSGRDSCLSSEECQVVVNTLNTHEQLGTLSLLDSHRPVYPLRFGSPNLDNWSVTDWCDQCHRKRGLVVWPDFPKLEEHALQGEALAALILGKIDAYEVTTFPDPEPACLGLYYRLLDSGIKTILLGGSGKDRSTISLGSVRTYVRVLSGETFSPHAWVEAVRAGRTFVTNGPLLTFRVNEFEVGSTRTSYVGERIHLIAEVSSLVPIDTLEILAGSEVIASKPASGNRLEARVEMEFEVSSSTWLAARCYSNERIETNSHVYAHTSPIWIEVTDHPMIITDETIEPLVRVLTATKKWVEQASRVEMEKQRRHLIDVLEEAKSTLSSRVS